MPIEIKSVYLSIEDAATILKVSGDTVRKMIKRGILRPRDMCGDNGKYMIHESQIEAMIAKDRVMVPVTIPSETVDLIQETIRKTLLQIAQK